MSAVKTPCIGICSTGVGDSVCRGCKRFAHEVIQWNGYSDTERQAIMQRLDSLLESVVNARVQILDESKLKLQLREHHVRFGAEQSLSSLVYLALRSFGGQLPSMAAVGCKVQAPWQDLNVAQLKETIEATFYELSCAHYQRYFPGHM